ncbi:restriction endonuclease [Bacillus sp. Marseille-Q3570]|uniref:restriction endonuclease n=1 Tax=Bacillus sp. Marseille-Q3570 TaxID=2963522 RepID=UPI0021B74204|nr:restriction endonuclease [Bacillus sp. Marseille-Q3570]
MIADETLYLIVALSLSVIIITYVVSAIMTVYQRKKLEERYRRSGIREIDLMNGQEFEYFLMVLFKQLGYRVKRTPTSNDFGADLILEGSERIVVQAKRYKSKVGIKAVQEINSAAAFYNANDSWVVTNNYFTSQAIKLADSTYIRLIDRNGLINLILQSKENVNIN